MFEIINVILRTILVIILIFILFKLMGKKQVSQMSMFDYITGITIGSVAADISLDIEKNLISGLICLIIYGIIDILISYSSLKSIKLRNFFEGKETPLIINGKINKENMAKNKITINILQTEARLMGIFNLDEVNNAILEPSGMISFELKEKEKPSTKKDIGLNSIINDNLEHVKKTEKWIEQQLKVLGKKQEEILLLTIDGNEKINIYSK